MFFCIQYLQGRGRRARIRKISVILDLDILHSWCPWSKGVSWPWLPGQGHRVQYQNSVSGPYVLTAIFYLDNKGVPWPWSKVTSQRSRSQNTHAQNPCPDHNSWLPCWIWIILDRVVLDPRVCHDFEVLSPTSRSQCLRTKIRCLDHNSSLPYCIWIILHTIIVHNPRVCHDLDQRSRSQYTHTQNPCLGLNSSLLCWIWIIFHTVVVHGHWWPKGV